VRRALPLFLLLLALPWAAQSAGLRAKFVSQVVPDQMAAGQRYTVVVQFRNEGRRSWPASVRLAQTGNRAWGKVSARLDPRKPVPPGQIGTFRAVVKAPSRPGTYTLRWRPREGNAAFGPQTPAVKVTVVAAERRPNWDAEFVHQQLPGLQAGEPPFALLQVGRAYPVTLVFKNTGQRPWKAGEVRLVPLRDGARVWSVSALDLPRGTTVAPGEFHAFRFTLLAPLEPGIYPFQWRLQRRGKPFGDASERVSVTVR